MNTYSFENDYEDVYTFEIVDKIPKGYIIWNIDFDLMQDGLVPLCQVRPGTCDVITDTLKAIRFPDASVRELLAKAVSRGINARTTTAKKAREIIRLFSEV